MRVTCERPECPGQLLMTERQGVEIDYCGTCRGVWLDRGELDKIVERSLRAERDDIEAERRMWEAQAASRRAESRPGDKPSGSRSDDDRYRSSERRHDDRYRDDRYRDDDDDRYGDDRSRRKKKKSFLQDLLDF